MPVTTPTVSAQRLSAGAPSPLNYLNLQLFNAGLGNSAQGQVSGVQPFNDVANLGDLSGVTNDSPAQAIIGLRVDGGVGYVVTVSRQSFLANNLQNQGRRVDQANNGSFIRIFAGAIRDRTARQGAAQVSPSLIGQGLTMDQLSAGVVNPASTAVLFASGQAPAGLGALTKQVNDSNQTVAGSVEVPIYFSVPTGLALGPINPHSRGIFSATLQFAVFARP